MASNTYGTQEIAVPVRRTPTSRRGGAHGGRRLCSIADFSSAEIRAFMKLGHDVKRNPQDIARHSTQSRWC